MTFPILPLTTGARGGQLSDLFLPLVLLLAVVAIGTVVIHLVRRSTSRDEDSPTEGFTLHDLRTMHEAGDLTDEEFERARAALIGRVTAGADEEPDREEEPGAEEPT
ncbi:MAG: SHOCT domain-containing protein [Phycisphaerales bacterium]|nr:MAG: SHOCT domain-containing protein [Phycisphaerales bacterium]